MKLALLLLTFSLSACSKNADQSPPGPGSTSNTIQFNTVPPASTDHNRAFNYTFRATHSGNLPVAYDVLNKPVWMNYDTATKTLSGIPDWANLNKTEVFSVKATAGGITATQNLSLKIKLGEIICDSEVGDPALSEYILPFEVGKQFLCNQSYCPPNPAWGHHNWFALDFQMPIGTNIIASRAGQVLHIEERWIDGNRTAGQANYVYVMHSDGTVAEYYHLTQNGALVNIGDNVQKGQVIALSGDTGPSNGPHLHFVLYRSSWTYSQYQRQYTLPVNFKNSDGLLNVQHGLIYLQNYKALPW